MPVLYCNQFNQAFQSQIQFFNNFENFYSVASSALVPAYHPWVSMTVSQSFLLLTNQLVSFPLNNILYRSLSGCLLAWKCMRAWILPLLILGLVAAAPLRRGHFIICQLLLLTWEAEIERGGGEKRREKSALLRRNILSCYFYSVGREERRKMVFTPTL